MGRQLIALLLAALLFLPEHPFASDRPEPGGAETRSDFMGTPLLWGAFALVNGALLTSSIIDLKFYNDRAGAIDAEGGDATPYWDASSREKFIIGLTSISFIFSLAALKKSFQKRSAGDFTLPDPAGAVSEAPVEPSEKGVEVISLQGRVRYDTLYTSLPARNDSSAAPAEADGSSGAEAIEPPVKLLAFETAVRVDTARIDTAALGAGRPVAVAPEDPVGEIIRALPDTSVHPLASVAAMPEIPGEPFPSPHGDTGFTGAAFELLPFAVHVSSFKNLEKSEEIDRRWRKRGEPYTIEEHDLGPEKGIWYRVLVGNYATWDEAVHAAAELTKRYSLDYAQAVRRNGS